MNLSIINQSKIRANRGESVVRFRVKNYRAKWLFITSLKWKDVDLKKTPFSSQPSTSRINFETSCLK